MRVVVQRSGEAQVVVGTEIVGKIERGLVCLVGIAPGDGSEQLRWMADKIVNLRIFEDENGKMNRSLLQEGGQILVISQFTLYGDCRKGRRPSYNGAARPEHAEPLIDSFCGLLESYGVTVETGRFGAEMAVSLTNQGPVTLVIDSKD